LSPEPTALVTNWLRSAIDDARRRGLPELEPLLEGLARSLAALRTADAEYAAEPQHVHAAHDDPRDGNERS
jgi:hypothetical protein